MKLYPGDWKLQISYLIIIYLLLKIISYIVKIVTILSDKITTHKTYDFHQVQIIKK